MAYLTLIDLDSNNVISVSIKSSIVFPVLVAVTSVPVVPRFQGRHIYLSLPDLTWIDLTSCRQGTYLDGADMSGHMRNNRVLGGRLALFTPRYSPN